MPKQIAGKRTVLPEHDSVGGNRVELDGGNLLRVKGQGGQHIFATTGANIEHPPRSHQVVRHCSDVILQKPDARQVTVKPRDGRFIGGIDLDLELLGNRLALALRTPGPATKRVRLVHRDTREGVPSFE